KDREGPQELRAGVGSRNRFPLRWTERRGGYGAPRRHEQDREPTVASDLLLWPCAPACAANDVEGQDGKRRGRAARLLASRQDEWTRGARSVESGYGEKGGLTCKGPRHAAALCFLSRCVRDQSQLVL